LKQLQITQYFVMRIASNRTETYDLLTIYRSLSHNDISVIEDTFNNLLSLQYLSSTKVYS